MKTLILTALATLLALPALADTAWTGTGPRGSTAQGSASCARGGGSLTCQGNSTWTGPIGQTATRSSTRTGTADSVTVTGTTNGPRGQTTTSTRNRSR